MVKLIDAKGRVAIGKKYAGATMLLSRRKDGAIILKPAAVVPAQEEWLWQNPRAMKSVQRGLKQARAGKFTKGPNLKAAANLANRIED